MSGKWMTYDELVASGWQEGEEVVVRFMKSVHQDEITMLTIKPADYRCLYYRRVRFLRLPHQEKRFIVVAADRFNDRFNVIENRVIRATAIPTREAAERIAAIFEGVA